MSDNTDKAREIWERLHKGVQLRMGDEVYEILSNPNEYPASVADVAKARRLSDDREVNIPWEGILATLGADRVVEIVEDEEESDVRDE